MYVEIIRMKPEKGIISRNQEDTSGNKVEFRSKVSRFSFSVILIYEKNGKMVEINFSQE